MSWRLKQSLNVSPNNKKHAVKNKKKGTVVIDQLKASCFGWGSKPAVCVANASASVYLTIPRLNK